MAFDWTDIEAIERLTPVQVALLNASGARLLGRSRLEADRADVQGVLETGAHTTVVKGAKLVGFSKIEVDHIAAEAKRLRDDGPNRDAMLAVAPRLGEGRIVPSVNRKVRRRDRRLAAASATKVRAADHPR